MNEFQKKVLVSSQIALVVMMVWLVTGCASSNVITPAQSTSTAIQLSGKNYRLINAGAEGDSYGFRFLGIIPFTSPHYAAARKDLYASVGTPLAGKAIALINESQDRSTLYLILFSIPKITITGDVIEFTDQAGASGK